MDNNKIKIVIENLEKLIEELKAIEINNQPKYLWGSSEFKDVLTSVGKKACGNDKTAKFHINKVAKFPNALEWLKDTEDKSKSYYIQRLRLLDMCASSNLKDWEKSNETFIKEEIEKIRQGNRSDDFKITERTNEDADKIISKRLIDILSGQVEPTKFDLFGVLLPPRRAEIAEIMCVENSSNLSPNLNYYVKETRTFIFDNYKTQKKYGTQFFCLDELEEQLPFLDEGVNDIVIKLVEELYEEGKYLIRQDYRNGEKYTGFSSMFCIANSFNINEARKHWSTKVFKNGNINDFKKLCRWLSHSVSMDINHYQKL